MPKVNSPRWLSLEDLPGEEWRDIPLHEGSFQVSNYGRIKALPRRRENNWSSFTTKERIRRLAYNRKGYLNVMLTEKCQRKGTHIVHRMVAQAFLPNEDDKPQVDHINTIKDDNRVCNLRWVTDTENAQNPISLWRATHSRIGKKRSEECRKKLSLRKVGSLNPMYGKCGEQSHRSKKVLQYTVDGVLLKEWVSVTEANKYFKGHISSCCRGERQTASGYVWRYKNEIFTNP